MAFGISRTLNSLPCRNHLFISLITDFLPFRFFSRPTSQNSDDTHVRIDNNNCFTMLTILAVTI
jgi:hypothetical protein